MFIKKTQPAMISLFFFFNDPATTEIYPLPPHDALPISQDVAAAEEVVPGGEGRERESSRHLEGRAAQGGQQGQRRDEAWHAEPRAEQPDDAADREEIGRAHV